MTGKTCLRLVGILGLELEIISQIVPWYENSFRIRLIWYSHLQNCLQCIHLTQVEDH